MNTPSLTPQTDGPARGLPGQQPRAGRERRKRTQLCLWLAFVGLVVELLGLALDAVLHSLDAGLAAREGIFTLTNPAHLLFIVGLGLATGATAAELLLTRGNASLRSSRSLLALASSSLLIALSAAAGGAAAATGSILGGAAHVDHSATALHQHDNALPPEMKATLDKLEQTLRETGTVRALDQLDAMAGVDPDVQAQSHQLTHALGRYSFTFYRDAARAFQECDGRFESGCYHGVLEGYFEDGHQIQPQEITQLCGTEVSLAGPKSLRFQCLHGLGHGLMSSLNYNLYRALGYCDYLPDTWDARSCYSGVFMQNVVFAFDRKFYPQPAAELPEGAAAIETVREDDLLYPCDRVTEKYASECYRLQSSVILMFNGYDFEAAATTCETAPEVFISACYRSLGRDIAGFTTQDPVASAQLCLLGSFTFRQFCFAGVASTMANADWKVDKGIGFCEIAPADAKTECYRAVGEYASALHTDLEGRIADCAKVEAAFVGDCRSAAQLDRA